MAPVAPIGWPFDSSPPEVLTGMRPPSFVAPLSVSLPPSPMSQKPRFSICRISAKAEASCTSATSMSSGPQPAIS